MNYYIADLHFGHKNILSYDNRKFKTVEEHDNFIINNWNEVVGIDDEVFILGDVSWHKEIEFDDGDGLVLCHYPIPCFNHHYYGWYHLYGHVHDSFEYKMMERCKYEMEELYDKPCMMYNVGCMLPYMNYMPQTLDYIIYECEA